jgi:Trk-type K+ transport system membrane component
MDIARRWLTWFGMAGVITFFMVLLRRLVDSVL